jgi:cytochrome b pre-mRNA-processing protein 3
MFGRWRERRRVREMADRLYGQIVAQARRPEFYVDAGVPDTVDGRFEMVVLHAHLVIRRLLREPGMPSRVGQSVFETLISDMDRNLREMGVGDLSVGRKVRGMATAFYGRARAYDDALAAVEPDALSRAVARNVFGTVWRDGMPLPDGAGAIARYIVAQAASIDALPIESLAAGDLVFPLPAPSDRG